ncbi:MAG: hypothetical protein QOJ90_2341, partial [Actinomycetota bacterium]|nr:hypothetical protein [Actinomycetota bacterium]
MLREMSEPPVCVDVDVDVEGPGDDYWAARGMTPVPQAETRRSRVEAVLGMQPAAGGLLAGLDPMTLDGDTRVDLLR